jgi:hypothetical protein
MMSRNGRVYDPGTRRWYKDGFAPFQLPEYHVMTCGECGGTLYAFRTGVNICRQCTYGNAGRQPGKG